MRERDVRADAVGIIGTSSQTWIDDDSARVRRSATGSPNPLNQFSFGTKNKNLKRNPDGSLTLYAGATSPGPEHEGNWQPPPIERV